MLALDKVGIFKGLSEKELAEIGDLFSSGKFDRKQTIFSEGDPPDWLYIVTAGRVKITKLSQEGKEIILETIGPDDFFGGIAVVRGFPYPANAVAAEPTEILKISRNNMMKVLDRFPSVMFDLVKGMGDRIKDFHETTRNIALEKVGARIASLLLKLSEQSGRDTPEGRLIDLKLTKQDIAEMVGTTIETAIRTMSRFRKEGYIAEKGGRIVVRDMSGLKSVCC